jgi:hypothetical protein
LTWLLLLLLLFLLLLLLLLLWHWHQWQLFLRFFIDGFPESSHCLKCDSTRPTLYKLELHAPAAATPDPFFAPSAAPDSAAAA